MTRVSASNARTTRCRTLTPATASSVITTSPSTMAVPKSGWSMTRPIGTAASPMVTVKRHGFISPRCSLAYPASATTIPNFTSSDGWSWKPPGSWNHGCDVCERRVVAQLPVVDREQQRHHDEPDEDRSALALHEVELVDPLESQALAGRRVDHQHAERGDGERRADEQRVEVTQQRRVEA